MTKQSNLDTYKTALIAKDDICKNELKNLSTIAMKLGMKYNFSISIHSFRDVNYNDVIFILISREFNINIRD